MDSQKDVTLIRDAMAGKYGQEIKVMVREWAISKLLEGKEIPFSLSELYEVYHDFDVAFVKEFIKHQDWYVIWRMGDKYCEHKDVHLVWPCILLELLTTSVDAFIKEQIQSWLIIHTQNPRIPYILLNKAQKYPQLLDWGLCYLTKFRKYPDGLKLISKIKRIANTYPTHVLYAVRMIVAISSGGYENHVMALKALAELRLMDELDEAQKEMLDNEISHQLDVMDLVDLRRCLNEGVLSAVHRIYIGRRILHLGYWEDKILSDILTIYLLAFVKSEVNEKLIVEWNLFVHMVGKYHPEMAADLFLALSKAVSAYVEKMRWDVSLMEWNPGMNFQNYAPEFARMTIQSLDYAVACNQFRPRAFLTALNVWVFDEEKRFDDEWFENLIARLPQNCDKSMTWDDDLQKLFMHLSMLHRYRMEIQSKDGDFIIKQAKRFVQMLIANYALSSTQISQIHSLCDRLHIEINMDEEMQKMEQRLQQLAKQKEEETAYLITLLSTD